MNRELIYWHQSLFLQPQHFQILDRRISSVFRHGLSLWAQYPYGLEKMEICPQALAAGIFQINELEFIAPASGERVRLPQEAVCPSRPLPRDLDDDHSLMVYLGLRLPKAGEALATVVEHDDQARGARSLYLTLAEPVLAPDSYSQGPAAELRYLKVIVNIIFEPELPDFGDYAVMPVARVLREGGGLFRLDPDYFPPLLNLAANSAVHDLLRSIRDRLAAKTRNLELGKATAGSGVEALTMLMALQNMAQAAARLDNILAGAHSCPPWLAYAELKEIMAALSVFSLELDFTGAGRRPEQGAAGPYEHHNSGPGFRRLREAIFQILDSISSGPRYLVRFQWRAPYMVAELPGHMLNEGREFWLIIKTPQGREREEVAEQAARYMKLASKEGLPVVLAQALEGVPVSRVQPPPAQLPKGQDLIYFRIHHESRLWEELAQNGLLCLYWDEADESSEIQLAVITGGSL